LVELEPKEEFYIVHDNLLSKGNSIITKQGERYVLFNEEGALYESISDDLSRFFNIIGAIVGLSFLIGGIALILINTGHFVFWSLIMIPIAYVLTTIIIAPIMLVVELIKRFF
jgi:hypothetical protein